MTLEEVIDKIEALIDEQSIEVRDKTIDCLLDDVPFDRSRVEEIEQDIEELRMEAHNLDSPISRDTIKEIIEKYRI